MNTRTITLLQPRKLVFGVGCIADAVDYVASLESRRVHIVSSPSLANIAEDLRRRLETAGSSASVDATIAPEPTIGAFEDALRTARAVRPDCILGIGGGSVLDIAKLLAAFVRGSQGVEETFGIGLLLSRECHLVCMPTTSGTGSEVSPNAILLDEAARLKKGVISPHLVPDATFIDPALTCSVPPSVTASTGLDTLTHCIEAYSNKFAHPLTDVYALQGVSLCARYLVRAVRDGNDLEAREGMSRASLYGGLCLGPVNTAAVHALAYPLGGEFHIAHGLSNAVLLPAVFRFNAEAAPERHAAIAAVLGADQANTSLETALNGAALLEQLSRDCGVETDLRKLGIDRSAIPHMAEAALSVQRLLRNNPRDVSKSDAERIYAECFKS